MLCFNCKYPTFPSFELFDTDLHFKHGLLCKQALSEISLIDPSCDRSRSLEQGGLCW